MDYFIIVAGYISMLRPFFSDSLPCGLGFLIVQLLIIYAYLIPVVLLGLFVLPIERKFPLFWRYLVLLTLGLQTVCHTIGALVLDFSGHTAYHIKFFTIDFRLFTSDIALHLDSKSVFFYVLVPFILFLCTLSVRPEYHRRKLIFFVLLALNGIILFTFLGYDYFHYFVGLELSIWPMFTLISIWGSRTRRSYAAYTYYFFSMAASVFFLVALIMIAHKTGSTSLWSLYEPITADAIRFNTLKPIEFAAFNQRVIFFCLFLALAIKLPIFPFHVWLPEVHAEASTWGSVTLASLFLKMAGFGIFQYVLPFFPAGYETFRPVGIVVGMLGLFYCSFILFRQTDIKKFIAYTSVLHMNFMVAALFCPSANALAGAYFSMVTHTIVSGLLFFVAGIIYDRYHTRIIFYMPGLSSRSPGVAMLFYIGLVANLGFPMTGTFIAELTMLLGMQNVSLSIAFLATVGASIAAVAHFYFINRTVRGDNPEASYDFFVRKGELKSRGVPNVEGWDFRFSELLYTLPLIFFVFQMNFMSGMYFALLSNSMNALSTILSGS